MQAVILCGPQAVGKSSFYKERFFATHVRVSLDLLRTRHRERRFLDLCVETQAKFVVDNTNPTRAERSVYIGAVKPAGYAVVGYYFAAAVADCLARNAGRAGRERVPDVAVRATAARLEVPAFNEGFDELYAVRLTGGGFAVEEWVDEARRSRPEDAGL